MAEANHAYWDSKTDPDELRISDKILVYVYSEEF